jgi:hypothetical protein
MMALAEIKGFLVHQKTISQCGGLPGPFSTAEASLTMSNGKLTDSTKRFSNLYLIHTGATRYKNV